MSTSSVIKSAALLLVGLTLGLLLSLQWRSGSVATLTGVAGRDSTSQTIARLEAEQDSLKETVTELRAAVERRQGEKAQSAVLLADLARELERQRELAGLTPVVGPGVEVTLSDSTRPVVPSEVNAEFYLIHDYDLRDVINLLWAAGAEAVSVNDERLVATSSIYCVGATIMVNDTRMSPPYVVRAIGPAEQAESLLKNVAFLADLKDRVSRYKLEFKVSRQDELSLPSYDGSFVVTHAILPE